IKPKAPPRRKTGAGDGPTTATTSGEPSASTTASAPASNAPQVAPVAPMVAPVPVASLPVAPPVGRLDSMRKPLAINTGATRGTKHGLKFKPKAPVRKRKEELAALEAQEIGAASAQEGAAPSPLPSRGRGTRGRGDRGASRGDRGGRGRG